MSSPRRKEERGSGSTDLSAQSAHRELGRTANSSALDWSREVVRHTRDLVCIHNLKGQLLSINPEPARLLGYTVDELLRIPMREMLPQEFRPQIDEYLEKIARDGEANGLLTVTTRAGEKRVWEYHNTLHRSEGAEPVVHGIAHDVTEHRRIAHELRKSEKQIRLFIEHAPAALAMFDREMRYLDASRRWRDHHRLGDRDLRGVSHYEVFPEIPERWKQAHRRGLGGEIVREECDRFKRSDGSVQWLCWEVRPWRDAKGDVGGIVIFAEDLTELKQAEEALAASESRFRTVFEKSPVGIYLVDRSTGRFLRANQRYCELVGRTEEELKNLDIVSVTHPDDRAAARDYLQGLSDAKISYFEREKRYIRPDGSIRWVYATGVVLPEVSGETPFGVGIVQDITARKLAEEALRMSEAELREAQRLGHIGSWYRDLKTDTLTWSEQIDSILGSDPKARLLTFAQAERFFAPESWQRIVRTNPKLLSTGGRDELEVEFRRRDGTAGWAIMYREAVRDGAGHIVGIRGVGLDISARKRAEEALRGSEERYRLLFEKGIAGVIITNLEGQVIQCNDAWARMFGFEDAAEAVGSNGNERWPDSAARSTFVDEIRSSGSIINRERQFRRKNGDVFWGLVNSVLLDSGDGPSIQSTVFDITKRKRAEEELRASEERMRLAQQVAQIGTFERNMQTGEGIWTPETEKMFGLQPGQGPKSIEEFLNLIHPEDRQQVQSLLDESITTGSMAGEWRVIWPDGSVHWIDSRWRVFKDEQGRPLRAVGIGADITERKRAEAALQQSEAKFKSLFETANDAILISQGETFSDCNLRAEILFGCGKEDIVGHSAIEFSPPTQPDGGGSAETIAAKVQAAMRGLPQLFEWRHIRHDGTPFDAEVSLSRVITSEAEYLLGSIRDITERKLAEEALRANEARERAHAKELETILDTIPIPVLIARDPQCTEITANRAGYEHLRLPMGSNVSASAWEQHVPRHRFLQDGVEVAADRLPMDRAAATGRPVCGVNTKLVFPDGVERYELGNAAPLFDEDGNVRGVIGAAIDLTDRVRAEEALRESEERLRLAQEVANIGTFDRNLITGEGQWTKQTMTMYGLPADAPAPALEQVKQMVHPEDRKLFSDLLAESMEAGQGSGEWRVVWPDGTVHWVASRWRVFKDPDGKPVRMLGSNYDVTDRKRIEEELRQAKEKLTEEKHYFEQIIDTEMGFEEIVGSSSGMKSVMQQVSKVASSDATVLLLGDTGVGKELVARAIHRLSLRKDNSFIKMNCAAIPSGLLESELFGSEKGAYTGSVSRKIGRLELADKGTIFLDEIGEIALALQPKLLRVVQDQEFERLGGTQTIKVNFRLIAATNRDLADEVHRGQFRSDLFYRLNVFPIRVPALRERREDIPMLVEYFVKKIGRRLNKVITSVPRRTLNELCAWDWPGNVRELENFIERSVILSSGPVLAAPLGELQARPTAPATAGHTLEAAERKLILEALRLANGRISGQRGAAARLGLKRTTLQSKLKQLGINARTLPPI